MLVSHRHRFIFLKTTKTAGTSVEISLSRYLGPEDVITPISAEDEVLRAEGRGRPPQNFDRRLTFREVTPRAVAKRVVKDVPLRRQLYWNHMPAAAVRARVGEEAWNSYFRFCFVRNPWDWAVSQHFYRRKRVAEETMDESLRRIDLTMNRKIYSLDDEIAVDFVGRYESLNTDLATACERIGLEFDGWLPRAKGGFRTDRRSYREILDQHQADLIADTCTAEIASFGYRF